MEENPLGQTLSDDEKTMLGSLADEFAGFIGELEGMKDKAEDAAKFLDEKTGSVRDQIESIMADVPSFADVHDTWKKAYVAIKEESKVEEGVELLKEYVNKLKSL